ncbi:MAG: hypothetical protein IBJ03_13975 [Gemmatimonadaceae bacterium]|nr:hypothetical protein [Gemmatimonadaceae bacterium]
MRYHLALAVLLSLPVFAEAQEHPLVGRWNLAIPAQVRGADGRPTRVQLKGKLEVSAVGDSLVAILDVEAVAGQPPRKQERMVSLRREGTMRFVNKSVASLAGNGELLTRPATATYEFDVTGDQLNGTMQLEVGGVPGIAPRTLTGTRVAS